LAAADLRFDPFPAYWSYQYFRNSSETETLRFVPTLAVIR